MKNGHIDSFQPIRAIPFVFSTNSFFAGGFSTLRLVPIFRTSRRVEKPVSGRHPRCELKQFDAITEVGELADHSGGALLL
jgi:hypothetical protein